MPVARFRFVIILQQPFLQLPVFSDLIRRQAFKHSLHPFSLRILNRKNFGRADTIGEQVPNDLNVHRRPEAHACRLSVRRSVTVLRAVGRSGNEKSGFGIFHQEIEVEQCGLAHNRVCPFQIIAFGEKGVVFPQVAAEPAARRAEGTPARMFTRRSETPDVGDGMHGPAPGAIVHRGRLPAGFAKGINKLKEGTVAFMQVGDFRGPVVHLVVDVVMVVGVPRRLQVITPDALQVGGQRARPRTGQEQVAAELKIQGHERRVFFAPAQGAEPFIDWHAVLIGPIQAQRHPVHKCGVVVHMGVSQCGIGFGGGGVQVPGAYSGGIGMTETGGGAQQKRYGPRALHVQCSACCGNLTVRFGNREHGSISEPGFGCRRSLQQQPILFRNNGMHGRHRFLGIGERFQPAVIFPAAAAAFRVPCQGRLEVQRAGACRRHAKHHHPVRGADKILPYIVGSPQRISNTRYARRQVQGPAVFFGRSFTIQEQAQVAQCLIRAVGIVCAVAQARARAFAYQFFVRKALGLLHLAREEQPPYLGQGFQRLRIVCLLRAARPQAVLIQGYPFLCHAAKDHGADTAIAQGQGFHPGIRRRRIPQGHFA
ncbi:MAG: hypothetical protein BWY09_00966 [Candidatus Hydrogenedentes bacterium ADurb.Bin179]|nr:MAG: hypothetical protein BWY09_00966 [Candidatus Hydrogenedentes bacterium ADurb.Bin179]